MDWTGATRLHMSHDHPSLCDGGDGGCDRRCELRGLRALKESGVILIFKPFHLALKFEATKHVWEYSKKSD